MEKYKEKTKKQLVEEIQRIQRKVDKNIFLRNEFDVQGKAFQLIEEKLNIIANNIPDIFYILDEKGNITFISNAIAQYGYSPDEMIGKNILDIVHPDDRDDAMYKIMEKRTGERRTDCYEMRFITKDRSDIQVEVKERRFDNEVHFQVSAEGYYDVTKTDQKYFLGTIGIARDITYRKQLDDKLKTYQKELEIKIDDFKSLVKNLNSIGIALSAEHNLRNLLEMVVEEARRFTRSDGGSLYINVGNELSFEIAQNDTLTRRLGKVPFKSFIVPINNKSIAGYVALTGEIINIPDLEKIGDEVPYSLKTMREFDQKMGYRSVSMLAVPMQNHKGDIIGILQLINSLDTQGNPVPYEQNLIELVTSLASQAAVSICNSRLIQDIKNLFESLVTYSAEAIDARSPHTAGHSERVAKFVMLQAECINTQKDGLFADVHFSEDELNELKIAAWLHDIGKIGVREYVLDKVNKVSDEKIETIRARFQYIKKDIENKANLKKLSLFTSSDNTQKRCEKIDNETRNAIEDIDSYFSLILKVNAPGFHPEEDINRLKMISSMKFVDCNGDERPFIEPEELENFMVKIGNLTKSERKEIESHVVHSLKILEKINFTEELKNIPGIAAAHHEMLNGTGYPKGLKADDIQLQSRIIAVADIFDALTAKDRPYKPPITLDKALIILSEEAENGRLDKDLVNLFISKKIYENVL